MWKVFDAQTLKAFEINAYNILVIKGIVDRYPVESPLTIAGFFDGNKYRVGGELMTLNDLEKKRLLPRTQDARLHFVLVCAAIGCPPLADFAYTPDGLDQVLASRTHQVLNDDNFLRPQGSSVLFSKIFKWYKSDFTTAGSVWDYINQYRDPSLNPGPVQYYSYDWSLNAQQAPALSTGQPVYQSNVQQFTPSALLAKGQIEVNFFNNLYTQREIRDASGEKCIIRKQTIILNPIFTIYLWSF